MQPLIHKITALELQRTHPLVRSWLPAARIESNVASAIDSALHTAHEGDGPATLVDLPTETAAGGGAAIARLCVNQVAPGLRDFIDIEHPPIDAPDIPALSRVLRAIAAHFADPAPTEFRVYQSNAAATDLRPLAGPAPAPTPGLVVRPGKRLHALPLRMIRLLPLPTHYERVTVQAADDLSFYDDYAALYADMHRERPVLAHEVPVEPLDKMRLYLAQKTLFHVLIDGQRAGVMAGLADRFAGVHGYRILEKFLYPAYRGRGFAPAAQRRFAEALPDPDGEVLYGFIHPDNVWSSRAARHDGREDIGGYFHLRIA